MEFPVYVASDCFGEKLNVALRYNPRVDTLDDLYAHAESAFALFTLQHVHDDPPQPFAFGYIFNDVLCQWDLLEAESQLAPCCQVYAFRCGGEETVDTIPEPINLVIAAQHADEAARVHSFPRTFASESPSPLRFIGERWAVPPEPRGTANDDGYGEYPAAAAAQTLETSWRGNDTHNGDAVNTRNESRVRRQTQAARFDPINASFSSSRPPQHTADVSTASFGAVRSHRFRLQLLSPPIDADLSASRSRFRVLQSPERNDSPSSHQQRRESSNSTSYTAERVQMRRASAEIPRAWYNPDSIHHVSTVSVERKHGGAKAALSSPPRAEYHSSTPLRHSPPSTISRYGSSSRYDGDHRYPPSVSTLTPTATITTASRRSSYPQVMLSAPTPPSVPLTGSPLPSSANAVALRPLGTPPLHPASYVGAARARRGSGSGSHSSILREERERVEERMHMDVDDLRVSLQAEDRGYERLRSTSHRYR